MPSPGRMDHDRSPSERDPLLPGGSAPSFASVAESGAATPSPAETASDFARAHSAEAAREVDVEPAAFGELPTDHVRQHVHPDLQPVVIEHLKSLAELLKTGPAFIGERHCDPEGRAAALDLMASGHVKELYLELASLQMEDLVMDPPHPDPKRKVSQHLRETTGRDPSEDVLWKDGIAPSLDFVGGFLQRGLKKKNPILLSDVIKAAQSAGVKVFFFDNHPSPERMNDVALAYRNRGSAEDFKRSESPGH